MKKLLSAFSASVLSFTILAGAPVSSYAASAFAPYETEKFGFTEDTRLDGEELSGMRGGLRIGSLNFDFAITSKTMVDGVLQHTSTISSSVLEKTNALKNISPNSVKQFVTEVVPSSTNPVPVTVTAGEETTDNSSPVNVATNNTPTNPPSNNASNNTPSVVSQSGDMSTGVGVTINSNTLATTIQNSNDNAVIQQLNQMDLVVSNLNSIQKVNIAQQMDFLAAQTAK